MFKKRPVCTPRVHVIERGYGRMHVRSCKSHRGPAPLSPASVPGKDKIQGTRNPAAVLQGRVWLRLTCCRCTWTTWRKARRTAGTRCTEHRARGKRARVFPRAVRGWPSRARYARPEVGLGYAAGRRGVCQEENPEEQGLRSWRGLRMSGSPAGSRADHHVRKHLLLPCLPTAPLRSALTTSPAASRYAGGAPMCGNWYMQGKSPRKPGAGQMRADMGHLPASGLCRLSIGNSHSGTEWRTKEIIGRPTGLEYLWTFGRRRAGIH